MDWILDLLLDTLIDSVKVFGIAFIIYFLLTFFESKIAKLLESKKKIAPVFGSLAGVIPQCGVSVVGADLYNKSHITIGTLVAIFIACSDEAMPIILGDFTGKWWMIFPLLAVKIIGGTIVGIIVDIIFAKKNKVVDQHLDHCDHEEEVHVGCCNHNIEEEGEKHSWAHEHLLHPLIHSLKIFGYTFVLSFLFGLMVELVGEETLATFMSRDGALYWLTPIFAVIVGLIPNCASSVLITELFVGGMIPFGALIAGLCCNAGLGPIVLFGKKENIGKAFMIIGITIVAAILLGYSTIWVDFLIA